jgi:hypothetical protein
MADQPKLSVTRLVKEYGRRRAVIGRCCWNPSRGPPGGQDLPLTSRAVSSKATETPFTRRTRPELRRSWQEVSRDDGAKAATERRQTRRQGLAQVRSWRSSGAPHRGSGTRTKRLSSPGQRSVVITVLAELISGIRRDKHMTDAYGCMPRRDWAPRDGGGLIGPNHDGPLRVAQSPALPDPGEAEHSVLAGSRTNKR